MPKAVKKSTTKAKAGRTVSIKEAAGGGAAEPRKPKPAPMRRDGKAEEDEEEDDDDDNDGALGFANAEAAAATVTATEALPRSLIYKHQRINTALTRANTHAHKTDGMRDAAAVFKQWKETRYPELRAAQRGDGFRPPVPKDTMRRVLGRLEAAGLDTTFATFYTELGARAKLGNQLVEGDAAGRDWELVRYEALCLLTPEAKDNPKAWAVDELWDNDLEPTQTHLELLAWAWSPVPHRTLASRFKDEGGK